MSDEKKGLGSDDALGRLRRDSTDAHVARLREQLDSISDGWPRWRRALLWVTSRVVRGMATRPRADRR